MKKSSFWDNLYRLICGLVLGPSTLILEGPTKWTSFLYGVLFTAKFLTKRSWMKKSFFWDNLYRRPSTWIQEVP